MTRILPFLMLAFLAFGCALWEKHKKTGVLENVTIRMEPTCCDRYAGGILTTITTLHFKDGTTLVTEYDVPKFQTGHVNHVTYYLCVGAAPDRVKITEITWE